MRSSPRNPVLWLIVLIGTLVPRHLRAEWRQEWQAELQWRESQLVLLGAFAVVAVILATAGIYCLIAYSVTQRTHEIGIRLALGAQRGDVLRLVMREGMSLVLAGLAIGIIGARVLMRVLESFLYEVSATDPFTFIYLSGMLTIAACVACYLPARRAMSTDPLLALRHE